jgi:hypothetical protein
MVGLSGKTKCGKDYRVICSDRKLGNRLEYLVLISKSSDTEIVVAFTNLSDKVSSQWFDEKLELVL